MDEAGRIALFIIGMGRSGTSALARTIALGGATLPQRLMAPNHGNPTGYWEPQEAADLNDAFLAQHGSSWCDTTLRVQTDGAITPEAKSEFVGRIRALIDTEFAGASLIVVKEPRVSALLPFWIGGAQRAGYEATAIQIIRHPNEVAASLERRDALPPQQSQELWLKYNLLAERDSRSLRRIFVSYGQLLSDWRAVMRKIVKSFDVRLAYTSDTALTVDAFLERNLRHYVNAEPPSGGPLSLLAPVYDILNNATESGAVPEEFLENALERYSAWIASREI